MSDENRVPIVVGSLTAHPVSDGTWIVALGYAFETMLGTIVPVAGYFMAARVPPGELPEVLGFGDSVEDALMLFGAGAVD